MAGEETNHSSLLESLPSFDKFITAKLARSRRLKGFTNCKNGDVIEFDLEVLKISHGSFDANRIRELIRCI